MISIFFILVWNLTLVHNKIWSLQKFSFYTISKLSWWWFTVYWIESSYTTLHVICLCWTFHVQKHSGWCVAVTILACFVWIWETNWLCCFCSYANTQQEQSFNEVTWAQENLRICNLSVLLLFVSLLKTQWLMCCNATCWHAVLSQQMSCSHCTAVVLTSADKKALVKSHGAGQIMCTMNAALLQPTRSMHWAGRHNQSWLLTG
jgi:hypothetical protein